MSSQDALIKAVRSGHLVEVLAALEAGAPVEINDGQGVPGLPLGIACFMGFPDIVRELVRRGAKVNITDNSEPVSPLSMAIRGGKTDVVKLLIELGADGRVLRWEQVLREDQFNLIVPGMTTDEVRFRIGRPGEVSGIWRGATVWSWRYETPFCQWFRVGLGATGVVEDTGYGPDPLCDDDDRPMMGLVWRHR